MEKHRSIMIKKWVKTPGCLMGFMMHLK